MVIHFVGRDRLAGPNLPGGCLQDVLFPDASLYGNKLYCFHIQQAHQCLARNNKSYQNLNVLESVLQR